MIIISTFTKDVDADPPGGGNFAACRARLGCWIYDKVPCPIGYYNNEGKFVPQIPLNTCIDCIECQGNTGNCDQEALKQLGFNHPLVNNPNVPGGQQPQTRAATH